MKKKQQSLFERKRLVDQASLTDKERLEYVKSALSLDEVRLLVYDGQTTINVLISGTHPAVSELLAAVEAGEAHARVLLIE